MSNSEDSELVPHRTALINAEVASTGLVIAGTLKLPQHTEQNIYLLEEMVGSSCFS